MSKYKPVSTPVSLVFISLCFVARSAKRLQIIYIQSQFREILSRLDVIHVDWESPTILSTALTTYKSVPFSSFLAKLSPCLRVQEWVGSLTQLVCNLVVCHCRRSYRPRQLHCLAFQLIGKVHFTSLVGARLGWTKLCLGESVSPPRRLTTSPEP